MADSGGPEARERLRRALRDYAGRRRAMVTARADADVRGASVRYERLAGGDARPRAGGRAGGAVRRARAAGAGEGDQGADLGGRQAGDQGVGGSSGIAKP